jgi:hypothetical protein
MAPGAGLVRNGDGGKGLASSSTLLLFWGVGEG